MEPVHDARCYAAHITGGDPIRKIIFKKQLNEWMRIDITADGTETKNLVQHDAMFREISQKLGEGGWVCLRRGETKHIYELIKERD